MELTLSTWSSTTSSCSTAVKSFPGLSAADGVEHGIVGEVISDDRFIELLLRNNASYVPTLWVYPVPEAMQNLATVSRAAGRAALGSVNDSVGF